MVTDNMADRICLPSSLPGRKTPFLLYYSWFSAAVVLGLGKDHDLGWNTPFKQCLSPPREPAWHESLQGKLLPCVKTLPSQWVLLKTDNTLHALLVNTAQHLQHYCLIVPKAYTWQDVLPLKLKGTNKFWVNKTRRSTANLTQTNIHNVIH